MTQVVAEAEGAPGRITELRVEWAPRERADQVLAARGRQEAEMLLAVAGD